MATEMMANEKFIQETSRCIYENEDILVEHSFMSYPDNTREAVMLIALKKDGKIFQMETGATPLLWDAKSMEVFALGMSAQVTPKC